MSAYTIYHEDIPNGLILNGAVAIDTESMGLNPRRDRLCLIQVCDAAGQLFFVKFAGKSYNAPNLLKMFEDPDRLKIFHYARADLTTICHHLGVKHVEPVFCTKIASRFARTYTDAHGLKALVKECLDIELEKDSQTSNWGAYELTNKQLKYAANDVLYLHRLKDTLEKMLEKSGRMPLVQEYFNFLRSVCSSDLLEFDPASILNHH
jgi:ribonuclease D